MDSEDEDSAPDSTEPSPESHSHKPPNPSTPLGGPDLSEKHMVRKLFTEPAGSSRIPGGSGVGSFQRFLDRSLSGGNYRGGGPSQHQFSTPSPSSSAASSSRQPRVTPLQIRLADLTHEDSGEHAYGEDDLGEEEAVEEENEVGIYGVGDDTERPFDITEVEPDDDEVYGEEEDDEEFDEEEIGQYNPGLEYTGNYYASAPSIPHYYQPRGGHNLIPAATRIPFDRRLLPSTSSLVSTSSQSGQQGIKLHIRRATPGIPRSNQRQIPITISSNEGSREAIGIDDQSNSENSEDSDVVHVQGEIEISPVKISPLASTSTSRDLASASSRLQGIVDSMKVAKANTEAQSRRIPPVPQQMLEKIRKLQNVELIEIDVDDQSDPEEVEAEVIQPKRVKLMQSKTLSKISPKAITNMSQPSPRPPPTIVIDAAPSVPEKRKRGRPRGSKSEGPSRRTERKRKPTTQFATEMTVPRFKIRRREGGENSGDGDSQSRSSATDPNPDQQRMFAFPGGEGVDMITTNSEVKSVKPRGRGRERPSTGRPRGRPRGSTLKSRMERDAASASVASIVEAVLNQSAEAAKSSETEGDESPKKEGEGQVSETEPTPTTRGGRRTRARGIRTPRVPRGSRARVARGSRRTNSPVKLKTPKVEVISPQKDPLQVFEEETRMSADIKPPASINSNLGPPDADETQASNISSTSTSVTGTPSASASAMSASTKMKKFSKDFIEERKPVTAQTLFEYAWPNEPNAEQFMLQEQVSEYLGIKSFKRKYPDMLRRVVDMEERDFLRERKIVSETQCDLGLTALNSTDVLDIMYNDFPEKYEEFRKVIQERRELEILQQKQLSGPPPPARDRSAEFMRRIIRSTARWNTKLNKDRSEDRSYSFDLQSFTLHTQQHRMKYVPPEATKVGYYPVAILAGQYCDNYKRYTPTELKYLPLNTVCYGPLLPQEKPHPSLLDSEESQSDSDDSSSSSSSSSSTDDDEPETAESSVLKIEETSNSIASCLTPTPLLEEKDKDKPVNGTTAEPDSVSTVKSNICKTCEGDTNKNKDGIAEVVIHCTKCSVPNHPSCLELSLDMLPFIKKYNWQCTDCKNCIECNDPADEDKMLFCDLCDRGYHIYCVGLRKVPTGRWHCRVCSLCHSCGANQPSQEDRAAEWHHEFKKGEKGVKYFMHSLCTACHKLFKKGLYCPSCLKCHVNVEDKNLMECRSCEKKVHKGFLPKKSNKNKRLSSEPRLVDRNLQRKRKLSSDCRVVKKLYGEFLGNHVLLAVRVKELDLSKYNLSIPVDRNLQRKRKLISDYRVVKKLYGEYLGKQLLLAVRLKELDLSKYNLSISD